jgi:hypothetical protein
MPFSNSETQRRFYDGLGSNIMVQYSVIHIIALHGRIAAREYVERLGSHCDCSPTAPAAPFLRSLIPSTSLIRRKPVQVYHHHP